MPDKEDYFVNKLNLNQITGDIKLILTFQISFKMFL